MSAAGAEYERLDYGLRAPKARNMKARGKREARRPWSSNQERDQGLKGRNIRRGISPFQGSTHFFDRIQGRRARFASRLPLAFIFRAFGAALASCLARLWHWRHVSRPLALTSCLALALFGPPVLNLLRHQNASRRNPLPKRVGTMLALFSVQRRTP